MWLKETFLQMAPIVPVTWTLPEHSKVKKKKKKADGLISSSVSLEDKKVFCSDEDFKPLLLQRGEDSVISLVIQLMNSGGW